MKEKTKGNTDFQLLAAIGCDMLYADNDEEVHELHEMYEKSQVPKEAEKAGKSE